MYKALIAALAAFVGVSASANAADLGGSAKDAPVFDAPSTSWTGLYIGVGVGGGASVTDLSANLVGEGEGGEGEEFELFGFDGIGGEGILGTGQVGYDFQLSQRLVIGAFVDYDFSGISTEFRAFDGEINLEVELDHMWTVGARFGLLATPDTLVYALLGYTQGGYSLDEANFDVDVQGWSFGGGIETRLTENWSIKGEYRFTQFDEETLLSGEGGSITAEPSVHTARAVISYRFNPFERGLEPSK